MWTRWARGPAAQRPGAGAVPAGGAETPSYSTSLFPSLPHVLPVASGSPVAMSWLRPSHRAPDSYPRFLVQCLLSPRLEPPGSWLSAHTFFRFFLV